MKIVFCHDTKIIAFERFLYSSGGLNQKIISRYQNLSEELTLMTRKSNSVRIENLSLLGGLDRISFAAVPDPISLKFSRWWKAYRIINRTLDENDFIITRLPSIIGLLALFLAKKKNKKFLVEIVGCGLDSYKVHSLKGRLIAYPFYRMMRYLVRRSENILYVTNSFLQKRYPSASPHTIGCSDVEVVVDDSILAKRLSRIDAKSEGDLIKIGMMGFLGAKYKGFDLAFKALQRIANENKDQRYLLEIVGGGDQLYLKNLITQFGLNGHVKIIGPLCHPMGVFEWLDNVDIFIQPSKTEGMPRSLIEAMSRACACIGSDAGEIPELLDFNYVHGKGDSKKLAQSIIDLSKITNMKSNSCEKFHKSVQFDTTSLELKRNNFYRKSMNLK